VEWHALVARIAAATEGRSALAHARNFASARGEASFAADFARMLGRFAAPAGNDEPLREYDYPPFPNGVNRVDSGRGKSPSAIPGDTAGNDTTGDRGLK
jgi:hypothetical protein